MTQPEATADVYVANRGGVPTAFDRGGTVISSAPQTEDAAVVFQAAFDNVQSNGGGTVHIGPGEFSVGQDFTPHDNTTVVGAGMGQTVIKATSQVNFGNFNPPNENIELRDFTFDGQNQGGNTRMFYSGARNCLAERVALLNCGEREGGNTSGGLAFRTKDKSHKYNRIINCYAENCAYVSLSTQKKGGYNEIRGCIVTNPNTSGSFTHPISIESNINSVMANNIVYGGSGPSELAGNPALNANATRGSVVSNNSVQGVVKGINVANGNDSTYPRQGTVVDGNMIQGFVEGIRIQNSSTALPPEEVIVSNNLIRDSYEPKDYAAIDSATDDAGILLNNNARAHIIGNTIVRTNGGVNGNGIGGPITVHGNYFKDSGMGIGGYGLSEFSGTDEKTVVSNNHIEDGGIFMQVPTHAVGNYVRGSDGPVDLRLRSGPNYAAVNKTEAYTDSNFGYFEVQGDSYVFGNDVGAMRIDGMTGGQVLLNRTKIRKQGFPPNNVDLKFNTTTDNSYGFTTENGGTASVADGGTISHGLNTTPTIVNVTSSVQGHVASVSSVGSSDITIELSDSSGSAVTSAETVYWEAKAR